MILHSGVSKKTLFSLLLPKQSIIFALPNACRLQSVGNAGGLIYEKDVFERLPLCSKNLASSKHHSRQMATKRLRGTLMYSCQWSVCRWRDLVYIRTGVGYLRCLSCVVWAMREPVEPG